MDRLPFSEEDHNRIIEMAWEDRTPFEAIEFQFGLTEKKVIDLMRLTLKTNSFKLWRKRVNSGVSQKHLKRRESSIDRFKSTRQKAISFNKFPSDEFRHYSGLNSLEIGCLAQRDASIDLCFLGE